MKVLIVFGTSEGQTRKIANFMGDELVKNGVEVTVCDATMDPPPADKFDAVIAGGSVHMGHYQSGLTHYLKSSLDILNSKPSAFFSVSLAVASNIQKEHEEADKITADYLRDLEWEPLLVQQIAGALKYSQYNYFKRLIMRMIAKKEGQSTDTSNDYEYTNWENVREFINEFKIKAESYKMKQNQSETVHQ